MVAVWYNFAAGGEAADLVVCAVKRNRRWETGRIFRVVRGEEKAFYWGIAEEAGNRSIEMQVDV